jgi:hypothetical protein
MNADDLTPTPQEVNARSDAPSDLPGAGYSSDGSPYGDNEIPGRELAALTSDIKIWVGANPGAAIAMAFGAGWLACRIGR